MRWPLTHINIEQCGAEHIGLLFNALGAARPGIRQHAALLLTDIAIQRRDIWYEYLACAFQFTIDGHRYAALYDAVREFFPSRTLPTRTLAGASFIGDVPLREQVEWAVDQGMVHPVALANQMVYVVKTKSIEESFSNGYAQLSDDLFVLFIDEMLPLQIQLWTLTGFLLQLLANIVEENFQLHDHAKREREAITHLHDVVWQIKAENLLGHVRERYYTVESIAESCGCAKTIAWHAIQILVDQRLLETAATNNRYRVVRNADENQELIRIATKRGQQ